MVLSAFNFNHHRTTFDKLLLPVLDITVKLILFQQIFLNLNLYEITIFKSISIINLQSYVFKHMKKLPSVQF